MASIMQGTTPSVTITIPPDALALSSVTAMEIYIRNGDKVTTYSMDEVTVDTERNAIIKVFTEDETVALNPKKNIIVQGRMWIGDAIVGIEKIPIGVADMEGVGDDG